MHACLHYKTATLRWPRFNHGLRHTTRPHAGGCRNGWVSHGQPFVPSPAGMRAECEADTLTLHSPGIERGGDVCLRSASVIFSGPANTNAAVITTLYITFRILFTKQIGRGGRGRRANGFSTFAVKVPQVLPKRAVLRKCTKKNPKICGCDFPLFPALDTAHQRLLWSAV